MSASHATLESLDEAQVTLDTGGAFVVGEDVSIEGLQEGDEVTIWFEEENGEFRMAAIEPADDDEEAAELVDEESMPEDVASSGERLR